MDITKKLIVLQSKFIEFDSFKSSHDKHVQEDKVKKEIKNLIFLQKEIFSLHNETIHLNLQDDSYKNRVKCYFNKDDKKEKEEKEEKEEKYDLPLTQHQSKSFRELFQTLYHNVDDFAKVVYEYVQKEESSEVVDEITFSTIPGLFGSLNNRSSIKSFLTFISEMIKIDNKHGNSNYELSSKFARPLFIIPSFLKFLTNIINSCSTQIDKVKTLDDAQNLTSSFFSSISETRAFCPFFVKELLTFVPDSKKGEFLFSSFLSEMCSHPMNFNLANNLSITEDAVSKLSSNFLSISDKLVEVIMSVDKPLQSPHDSKIEIKEEVVALTRNDLQYLKGIVKLASTKKYFSIDSDSFNSISYDEGNFNDNKYVVFFPQFRDTSLLSEKFKSTRGRKSCSGSGNDNDDGKRDYEEEEEETFESTVANILISIDQIPEGMPIIPASTTITQFLRMLLDRTFKLQRITLEVQITNLMDKYEDKLLSETATLLEEYFKTKKDIIVQYLQDMSLFSHVHNETANEKARLTKYLNKKKDVLIFEIIEKWANDNHLFEIIDENKSEYCQDSDKFFGDFQNFFTDCKKYCKEYCIKGEDIELILFDIIMSRISITEFIIYHEDYLEIDKRINTLLNVPKFYEKFFGIEKSAIDKYKKKYATLIKYEKLLDQPKKMMDLIPQFSTPLEKFDCFCKAIKQLYIIGACEVKDFDGDDKPNARYILFSYLNKFNSIASTYYYIYHFMSISEADRGTFPVLYEISRGIEMTDFMSAATQLDEQNQEKKNS